MVNEHRKEASTETSAGRLIDELIDYLRARQEEEGAPAESSADQERLLRATIRQLRQHPIPTAMLGISAIWLLLADHDDGRDHPPERVRRLEDAVVGQIKGGYAYTESRLRECIDRHPWAAGAVLTAAGLGAAMLLPKRRRRVPLDDFTEDDPEHPVI